MMDYQSSKAMLYSKPDEIQKFVTQARTANNSTIHFQLESPASGALCSNLAYIKVRVRVQKVGANNTVFTAAQVIEIDDRPPAQGVPNAARNYGGNPSRTGANGLDAADDVFWRQDALAFQMNAVSQASLSLNGASVNQANSMVLRELLGGVLGKDVAKQLACPYYEFSDQENPVGANGLFSTAAKTAFVRDPGESALWSMTRRAGLSAARGAEDSADYSFTNGLNAADGFCIDFYEPLCIGSFGLNQLVKYGEMCETSPFANYSSVIPNIQKLDINLMLQSKLAECLFCQDCCGENAARTLQADIVSAHLVTNWYNPRPANPLLGRMTTSVPTYETVVQSTPIAAMQIGEVQTVQMRFTNLQSFPDEIIIACKPNAAKFNNSYHFLSASGAYENNVNNAALSYSSKQKQKYCNMEITRADISVNTSTDSLRQTSIMSVNQAELDRLTRANVVPASQFPYSPDAWRKNRHYLKLTGYQMSALSYASSAINSLVSWDGRIQIRNSAGFAVEAGEWDLQVIYVYFNRSVHLSRGGGGDKKTLSFDKSEGDKLRLGARTTVPMGVPGGAGVTRGYQSRF